MGATTVQCGISCRTCSKSRHLFAAAVLGDGSVVTWRDADLGGDSRAVQDQLKNVQQIQASSYGFAAILGEGSVVTWGRADLGGDSRAVQDQLKSVQYIQASGYGFAAVLGDSGREGVREGLSEGGREGGREGLR